MIKYYPKKPIIVSAVQYTGDNIDEILKFTVNTESIGYDVERNQYYVNTLEGKYYIVDGDYIIRGVEGEFYPCKPQIFEKTYVRER